MSKQHTKRQRAHNPRNPNLCRICLANNIGKTRLAYGHTICQACARTNPETLPQSNTETESSEGRQV